MHLSNAICARYTSVDTRGLFVVSVITVGISDGMTWSSVGITFCD